ncbi:MAG: nuclear transport factor 2 family protein [Flavobacteriales bacterium]|nr:nuclear transport factor 2 family protein [Flavobacteriales bacterium]
MRLWLPITIAFASCAAPFTTGDEQAMRQAMAQQEVAWDNGDIDGFMEWYADSICFHSPRGNTCGKAQVTENYRRSYPTKEAMGDLTFDLHEVIAAGDDHAWVTGSWSLHRSADTLGGAFALLWIRQAEGWRILRDHTY